VGVYEHYKGNVQPHGKWRQLGRAHMTWAKQVTTCGKNIAISCSTADDRLCNKHKKFSLSHRLKMENNKKHDEPQKYALQWHDHACVYVWPCTLCMVTTWQYVIKTNKQSRNATMRWGKLYYHMCKWDQHHTLGTIAAMQVRRDQRRAFKRHRRHPLCAHAFNRPEINDKTQYITTSAVARTSGPK
jgi:hypothetical protein